MKEFETHVRSHFGGDHVLTDNFMKELRAVLAIERLPARLTPEEFQALLTKPESKRFAPLHELAMDGYHPRRLLDQMRLRYELVFVREAIESLRSSEWSSLGKTLGDDDREVIQQAIDDLLAKDDDWEFCDRKLSAVRAVPEAYLERFGYVLK